MIITIDKKIGTKTMAKRGDDVIVISERGDVAIVEHSITKERFSVRKENLQ
jgi:hypothetical protein